MGDIRKSEMNAPSRESSSIDINSVCSDGSPTYTAIDVLTIYTPLLREAYGNHASLLQAFRTN